MEARAPLDEDIAEIRQETQLDADVERVGSVGSLAEDPLFRVDISMVDWKCKVYCENDECANYADYGESHCLECVKSESRSSEEEPDPAVEAQQSRLAIFDKIDNGGPASVQVVSRPGLLHLVLIRRTTRT